MVKNLPTKMDYAVLSEKPSIDNEVAQPYHWLGGMVGGSVSFPGSQYGSKWPP